MALKLGLLSTEKMISRKQIYKNFIKMIKMIEIYILDLQYFCSNPVQFIIQSICKLLFSDQARIAQLVAYGLGTGEVPGPNTGKGENFFQWK